MGISVNEAGDRIAQLLQPEQPSDSAPEAEVVETEAPEEVQPEIEAPEPTGEQETEETTEETPEDQTSEGDTEPEVTKYSVKANGEDVEVTLDDLRKGYMMESDYRKKTTEVARQRDEVKQQYESLASKVADAEHILAMDLEDLKSEDNLELKEYDRAAYEDKVERARAKADKLQELKKELESNNQKNQQEAITKQKELLFQALPSWLDEKVLTEEVGMVNDLWKGMGFSDNELSQFTDHRLVLLSREAALYRKIRDAKPQDKKVVNKPKAVKPGTAQTPESKKSKASEDARARLRKTGKVRDAEAVIKQLLK